MSGHLLQTALLAAVPLWQMELQNAPWADIEPTLAEAAKLICEKGDILQFGGGRKGEVAQVFNATARGIAALSFAPGGVNVFGQHWEARHPDLTYPEAP
jgi:hypothetical protein